MTENKILYRETICTRCGLTVPTRGGEYKASYQPTQVVCYSIRVLRDFVFLTVKKYLCTIGLVSAALLGEDRLSTPVLRSIHKGMLITQIQLTKPTECTEIACYSPCYNITVLYCLQFHHLTGLFQSDWSRWNSVLANKTVTRVLRRSSLRRAADFMRLYYWTSMSDERLSARKFNVSIDTCTHLPQP